MGQGKTKNIWLTLFYAVCLVAALSFVGYHLYRLLGSDIVTVRAENRHFRDEKSYVGYIARDGETVALPSGSVRFCGSDGKRFKTGEVFAYIYSADKQPILDEIESLEYENEILTSAMYYTSLSQSEADAELYYTELMNKLSLGNFSVGSEADKLLSSCLSGDYVFDRTEIKKALSENESRISELEASLGNYIGTAKMPFTGSLYFGGDEGERIFTASLAKDGTVDEILSAISEYRSLGGGDDSLCTAVRFNKWYIILPVTLEDAKTYDKGSTYTLLIGEGKSECEATLDDVRMASDAKNACLVFSLTEDVQGFDYTREFDVSVVVNEYDGYRIPFSALRNAKDGTSGVYILSGGVVIFRRVEIVSTNGSYVLVRSYKDQAANEESEKTANRIYSSKYGESLFTGIYPGGAYTFFGDEDNRFDNDINRSLNIKGVERDVSIDLNSALEKHEYGYLEENEFIIIKGSSLYHGKIPG